ncbi:MAG: RNA-binding protein [Halanaeroarchaeum sp.]
MSSVPFHYVDLRAFSYDTEVDDRVESAIRELAPEDADVERMTSEGHTGDRIVVLSTRLERADEIRHVLARLRDGVDADRIRAELDDRIDDNNSLFVHLDKQAAYEGEVRLGEGLSLRAKVEAYPATREAAIENAREAL